MSNETQLCAPIETRSGLTQDRNATQYRVRFFIREGVVGTADILAPSYTEMLAAARIIQRRHGAAFLTSQTLTRRGFQ